MTITQKYSKRIEQINNSVDMLSNLCRARFCLTQILLVSKYLIEILNKTRISNILYFEYFDINNPVSCVMLRFTTYEMSSVNKFQP